MSYWALVCDASRARYLECKAAGQWKVFRSFDRPAGRAHGRDLETDAPGSVQQTGAAGTKASMAPKTTPHEVEVERFARDLSKSLQSDLEQGRFEQLILVAPPALLGQLRKSLTSPVLERISKQQDKDLSNLNDREIGMRIAQLAS